MAKARAPKVILRPRACFELGQRVTEVGAALAYADFFSKQAPGLEGVRNLSAGIRTAALAADRLAKSFPPETLGAEKLKKEIASFYVRIHTTWLEGTRTPKLLTPGELAELQRKTSELRSKTLEMWHAARLTCPNGDMPRAKKAKRVR